MARTRQLKPEFFLNEDLAAVSPLARLTFQGLWLLADRDGRLEDRPARIKAQIFPYHAADMAGILNELSPGFIVRYRVGEEAYIQITNFKKHQHIHPDEKQSTIPPCSEIPGDFKTRSEIKPFSSSPSTSPSTSCKHKGSARPTFVPPTIEEIRTYCLERKNKIDPEAWMAYYEARGWKFNGGGTMRNWKAAVITWEKNGFSNGSRAPLQTKIVGAAAPIPGKYDEWKAAGVPESKDGPSSTHASKGGS